MALAAACVAARLDVTTVTVDHGLQDGSASVAARTAALCTDLGAHACTVPVTVEGSGEAPARSARYAALGEVAAGRPVLVAHTADDDAEGLLLSLARGSGTGSLAGLRAVTHDHPVVAAGAAWLGRPLLGVAGADTQGSCAELGLPVWHDPHDESPEIIRSRVRHELLPLAQEILGGHVDSNLARSARPLREDADELDAQAVRILEQARGRIDRAAVGVPTGAAGFCPGVGAGTAAPPGGQAVARGDGRTTDVPAPGHGGRTGHRLARPGAGGGALAATTGGQ